MADIYRVFNSWRENQYIFLQFVCHASLLVEDELQEIIKRKFYCDKFPSVPPFPGDYDAQPKWWIEAVGIIDGSANEALKWQAKQVK